MIGQRLRYHPSAPSMPEYQTKAQCNMNHLVFCPKHYPFEYTRDGAKHRKEGL